MRTVRLCLLPLALFFLGALAGAQEKKPAAPDVDFRIVSETKGVEPGESLLLHVFISNKSAFPLEGVSLDLPKLEGIEIRRSKSPLAGTVSPFGHASERMELRASEGTSFGARELPFLLRFRWKDGATGGESARQATVAVDVQPPFSGEAKGLPGGTGTLFALLLPVIPAFLTFQLFDRWRTAKVFEMPTFSNDYIVPAFFIAILAKSLTLFLGLRGTVLGLPYLLLLSAVLGAVWPLAHWGWDRWHWHRWAFQEHDEPKDYLRKALFSPWTPRRFTRVTGASGKEAWMGILLRQPDGSSVLGSELQINHPSPPSDSAKKDAGELVKQVNQGSSKEIRNQLLQKIEEGSLKVAPAAYPKRGDQPVDRIVVSGEEIEGFVKDKSERRDLLTYSP